MSGRNGSISNNLITFDLERPAGPAAAALNLAATDDTAEQTIRLRIEGVKPPMDQETSIRVFVNCPNPTPATPLSDPSYVGSFTFFNGPGKTDRGHAHEGNFVLDATSAFQNLYGDANIPREEPVQVKLVGVRLFEEVVAAGLVEEIEPTSVQLEIISQTN